MYTDLYFSMGYKHGLMYFKKNASMRKKQNTFFGKYNKTKKICIISINLHT